MQHASLVTLVCPVTAPASSHTALLGPPPVQRIRTIQKGKTSWRVSIPPLRWWSQVHLWLCGLRCTGEGTARENLRCSVGELPGPLREKLVHIVLPGGDAELLRSEEWMRERADKLKEDVCVLFETCNNVGAKINLLDAIQRLGIVHLFEEHIGTALSDIHASDFGSFSLHEIALRFRLLREHGLWVSTDVFNKFKADDGNFDINITNDPRGLLSLYDAAHLFVHGEPELEEAISFARRHLELMRGNLKSPLAEQVKRTLRIPLARTCKRVEALCYMLEYEEEEGYIPTVLELAKLDFNLLQCVHLKELKAISAWWKDLYTYVGLSYVRDRVVEAYTWSNMVFYEQGFALARMIFAKLIILTTFMDDTYDAHATIEECRKLNTAIQRWDESAISILPEYLKKFYNELLSNFKEFEAEVAISENHRVAYTKKAFQNLSTYYLQEAEWFHQNHKPSFKDQVNLSSMSSATPMLCVGMMVGMGDAITKEAFEWTVGSTDAIMASAKIGRFLNDIAAFKRGRNRGDVESSIECYINEHNVTSEVAFAKIESLIEDEWKTTNQALFERCALLPAVQRVFKLTVSMRFFYDDRKDAYTFTTPLQETVKSLFVKPIPI